MSKAASRLYHQAKYGPLTAKTLHTILRRELMEQFGFEHMGLIADALIKRFLGILDQYSPDHVRLAPGQILWLAVAKDERPGHNKTMMATRLVPVRLTLVAPEDLERLGISTGERVRLSSDTGQIEVEVAAAKQGELPPGVLFIAYGDLSSRLMGSDTHASGMPTSKGIDVRLEKMA